MSMNKAFKSSIPFVQFVLPNGHVCKFINHLFHTGDPEVAELLEKEIGTPGVGKSKNSVIYIDTNELEVDPDALTPMAILEKQIRAKILLEMEQAGSSSNDRGTSSGAGGEGTGVNNTVSASAQVSSDKGVIAQLNELRAAGQQTVVTGTITQAEPAKVGAQVDMNALRDKLAAAKESTSVAEQLAKETEVATPTAE